jgi:hypothetical protein
MGHECHFIGASSTDGKQCEREAKHSLPMNDGNSMWVCDPCYDAVVKIVLGWSKGTDGEQRRELADAYFKKFPSIARYWKEK